MSSMIIKERNNLYENKNYEFLFQPIIDIKNIDKINAEALLRKKIGSHDLCTMNIEAFFQNCAKGQALAMSLFNGLAAELASFQHQHSNIGRISINVEKENILNNTTVERVRKILDTNRLDPSIFSFEITERLAFESAEEMHIFCHNINIFKDMGVEICIDDFGVMNTNISMLFNLDFDRVKIDKSFVQKAIMAHHDLNILEALVAFCKKLGKKLTIEGIETKEQFDICLNLGCTCFQGWYFSKAVPFNELIPAIDFIKGNNIIVK